MNWLASPFRHRKKTSVAIKNHKNSFFYLFTKSVQIRTTGIKNSYVGVFQVTSEVRAQIK
jgi:hypothetical protein